jgi:hypothetical protein
MDKARLKLAVYKQTGVALNEDDPAFAMVELCRLVLEDQSEKAAGRLSEVLVARLGNLPDRIQSAAKEAATTIGIQGTQRVVDVLQEARDAIAADADQATRRIAEQTGRGADIFARQVIAAVRAAQPSTQRGEPAGARWTWLVAGAALAAICFAGGFVTAQSVAAPSHQLQQVGRP